MYLNKKPLLTIFFHRVPSLFSGAENTLAVKRQVQDRQMKAADPEHLLQIQPTDIRGQSQCEGFYSSTVEILSYSSLKKKTQNNEAERCTLALRFC